MSTKEEEVNIEADEEGGEKAKEVIDRDAVIAAVNEAITEHFYGPSKDQKSSMPELKGRMLSEHSTIVDLNVNMMDTTQGKISIKEGEVNIEADEEEGEKAKEVIDRDALIAVADEAITEYYDWAKDQKSSIVNLQHVRENTKEGIALMAAVDEVITEYVDGPSKKQKSSMPEPEVSSYNSPRTAFQNLVIVDLNVNKMDTTLYSVLRTLTEHTYPHPAVVKWVINYVFLMKGDPRNVGLASEIFSRLSFYHPVAADPSYYLDLLSDRFVIVKKDVASDVPFFWFILEELNEIYATSNNLPKETAQVKNPTYYCDLDTVAKQEGLLMCLKITQSWLVDDFNAWKKEKKSNRRSLIGQLIWPRGDNEGEMTWPVRKLLTTLWNRPTFFQRLLPLLAELTQRRDRIVKPMYPFLGSHSMDLARELASKLLPTFKENGSWECDKHLRGFPAWLRLATLSFMLTALTGFQCLPEISCALTILQDLIHKFKVGRREVQMKEKIATEPPNPQLVAKYAKLKSVNVFNKNGMTRLFKACQENRVGIVKALLSVPLLELNLPDWMGQTPLFEACKRGSLQCVEALLQYVPAVGSTQEPINTRTADAGGYTPLMVAAEAGHTAICQLLLQHSGSVLLDDLVNENHTALDLCTCEETRALLQKYKDKRVETMIMTTEDMLLVATLCVVMLQSYLEVHRTWDIYHLLKRNAQQLPLKQPVVVEYSRYCRDFDTHINNARVLATELKMIWHLSSLGDVLAFLLER